MGKASRPKPERLAEKLLQIRIGLNLSQNELIKRLNYDKELLQGTISTYELGKREPSLPLLLHYARLAGVCVDVLIDDEQNLPVIMLTASALDEDRIRAQAAGATDFLTKPISSWELLEVVHRQLAMI